MHGDNTMLLEMINTGIDLNEIRFSNTPLSIAAISNRFSTVALLLDSGAKIKSMDRDAFIIASTKGRLEMVQFMCQRNIHTESRRRVYIAFTKAASSGHLEVAQYLAEKINMKRLRRVSWSHQYEALEGAISGKHYKIVRWLVEKCGISVHKYPTHAPTDSKSPISHAIRRCDMEMMTVLFKLGAKPLNLDEVEIIESWGRRWYRTDLEIASAAKAQNLNREWKEAMENGVSSDEFFGILE